MTDLTRIEERFRMANPIPDPTNPPATASPAAEVLLDLETRRGTMQTQKTTPTTPQPTRPRQRWNGPLIGAAAFVAVLVVGAIVLASAGDEPGNGAKPVTTAAPTAPATPGFTADDALAVASSFFDDFSAGDLDAVSAALTSDVAISDSILGQSTVADWKMQATWEMAQGTVLSSPECTVTAEVPGESASVTCDSETHNAAIQTLGGVQCRRLSG